MRVIKLADFLRKHDYEVYVLAAKGREISYFGYEDVVKPLNVTYIDDPLQAYLNHRATTGAKVTNSNSARLINFNYSLRKIERLINDWVPPDVGVFFVWRYYKTALDIVTRHNIRNVIVSSPPHSSQIIGLLLKYKLQGLINLIVDFRDSWNTRHVFIKKNKISNAINRFLEKKVLLATDYLVYVSSPMLKKIKAIFPGTINNHLLIMNGFDQDMLPTLAQNPCAHDALTVGYFGSLSDNPGSFADPTMLFQTLAKLEFPIKVVIYGDTRIRSYLRNQVSERVDFQGNIPHGEALKQMQNMDLLLVLYTDERDSDEVVTGKLFEYMSSQKPILVVGPKDMEAGRIVTEHSLGYHVSIDNSPCAVTLIERIYYDWQRGKLPKYNRQDLLNFTRQNQYSKLLPLLQ